MLTPTPSCLPHRPPRREVHSYRRFRSPDQRPGAVGPPDPRPDYAIRDAQRGGAGRGGAAQDAAGNGADARDRSEHRVGPVVDGFLVEIDDAAGIR